VIDVAQVRPNLFVGNAPQREEDSSALVAHGVSAVLCLQTDDDLAQSGLRWAQVEEWHIRHGLVTSRVPILDFSSDAVVAQMDETLAALGTLLDDGHVVYLHCSAGINRSPTIAIAYLVRTEGLSVAAALEAVRAVRPVVRPYMRALEAIVPRKRAAEAASPSDPPAD
jgi:protein-tyrosine phosphatase